MAVTAAGELKPRTPETPRSRVTWRTGPRQMPQFVEVITSLYACGVTVRETGHRLLAPTWVRRSMLTLCRPIEGP